MKFEFPPPPFQGEQGIQGIQGEQGETGADGASYEISVFFTSLAEANAVADDYPLNTGCEIYAGVDDPENGLYRRIGAPGLEEWEFLRASGPHDTDARLDALEEVTDGFSLPDSGVYESGSLFQITATDSGGDLREVFAIDAANGLIKGMLRGDYLAANEARADTDSEEVYSRGARGTVRKVRDRGDDYYYYQTDALGGRIRDVFTRKDRTGTAHILQEAGARVAIIGNHGQSWATNSYSASGSFGDFERESVLTLHITNAGAAERDGPIGSGAGISLGGTIGDICGRNTDDLYNFGSIAGTARQRLRRYYGIEETPLAEYCSGYPSASWTTGTGNGLGLGPNGTNWPNMLTMQAAFDDFLPNDYGLEPAYTSILWTQAGGGTYETALAELVDMVLQNDLLALPGTDGQPLSYYITQCSPTTTTTEQADSRRCHLDFCRGVEPRAYLTTPWYAFEYMDSIHLDGYGTARVAERMAWAMFSVEDLGIPWVPVCRSPSPIERSGQSIVVPLTVPRLRQFRLKKLAWRVSDSATELVDGIPPLAQDYGWVVKRSGVALTLSNLSLEPRRARVATTADITLSGVQTIDGVACAAGDLILVRTQTARSSNGLYIMQAGAWTRSPEMAVWEDFPETVVQIAEGATYADQSFLCISPQGGVLDTTEVWWRLTINIGGPPEVIPRCVTFDIVETISPGDVLEISYAWYGPGSGAALRAGCWGNLAMEGEPSVLFPGQRADHWCAHFKETITL